MDTKKTVFEEYDKVRIKATNLLGEIIDIYMVGNEVHYIIESDEKGVPGGRGDRDSWKIFDCTEKELQKVNLLHNL